MERKIAIVVEPDFLGRHVGVRHYLLAFHALLARRHRVDWIASDRDPGGERRWFQLAPQPGAGHAATAAGTVLSGRPAAVLRRSGAAAGSPGSGSASCWRTEIGSDLAVERYDAIVIGAPWIVDFESRLPARRVMGIVYDLVPNRYVFSLPARDKPFSFADRHRRGFVHYRDHCDAVLAISRPVGDDYARSFGVDRRRVVVMPPLLPASYQDVPEAANERPPRVVLAAPFDRRKGLAVMPAILNAAAAEIDTVSIYGGVRCSRRDVRGFFRGLQVRRVDWHPDASPATVQRLFLEAKTLLFPSFAEGLGMPVLEAQRCGCRVMLREIPPLDALAGPGSCFLPADEADAGAALARMVREPFDHAGLQRWARTGFDGGPMLEVVDAALGPPARREFPAAAGPAAPDEGGGTATHD